MAHNSGVSIDSIGAEFGGACATSFAGIFSNGVGDFFFWDGVGELQIFWLKISHFSHFFSSFETGSWEVNHSFESDLCCGDSWLRRSLRWNEVWTRWGEKVRILILIDDSPWRRCFFFWLALRQSYIAMVIAVFNRKYIFYLIHFEKIFAFLVYLECNNKISASIHLSFFSIQNLFQTSRHLRSQLPHCQLGSPFWMGRKNSISVDKQSTKRDVSMSLSKKVNLWSVSKWTIHSNIWEGAYSTCWPV